MLEAATLQHVLGIGVESPVVVFVCEVVADAVLPFWGVVVVEGYLLGDDLVRVAQHEAEPWHLGDGHGDESNVATGWLSAS